jgi:hypothetical protein
MSVWGFRIRNGDLDVWTASFKTIRIHCRLLAVTTLPCVAAMATLFTGCSAPGAISAWFVLRALSCMGVARWLRRVVLGVARALLPVILGVGELALGMARMMRCLTETKRGVWPKSLASWSAPRIDSLRRVLGYYWRRGRCQTSLAAVLDMLGRV